MKWWRRRELNPRPEASRERLLHAQPPLGSRPAASRRGKTAAGNPELASPIRATVPTEGKSGNFEACSGQLGLANYGEKRTGAKLGVIRYRNGDGRIWKLFASRCGFRGGELPRNRTQPGSCRLRRQRVSEAYPTSNSTRVTSTSLRRRRSTSLGSAASKKSSSASTRFERASSIVPPWLATSSSGQRAKYPAPSRSMTAVNWRVLLKSKAPFGV
jgi:hypothetical protein